MFGKKIKDLFPRSKRIRELGYTCSNRCRKKTTKLTPIYFFRSCTDINKNSKCKNTPVNHQITKLCQNCFTSTMYLKKLHKWKSSDNIL